MQSWVTRAGSLSNLEQKDFPLPELDGADFVLVKVTNCGINFADIFACLGLYSATPKGEFTPGLEFSGIVEEVRLPDDGSESPHSFKKVKTYT